MENKKKLKTDTNIVRGCNSIIAGILIGLGVIINTQTDPPFLGALLFSFGLLTIIQLKLPLFTGRIGFLENNILLVLFCNLIGIELIFCLYCLSHPFYYDFLQQIAIAKFSKNFMQMFIDGIFCGMLIHFAVKCKVSYLTSMAVIIFILIGAEHCIADFPYLITYSNPTNILKYIMIILGNSIGAIFIEKLIKNEQNR